MLPCNWRLMLCGTNHTTSSVETRETLQIPREALMEADSFLFKLEGIKEAIVVSTCNRVEFYIVADIRREPFDIVREFYQQYRNQDIASLEQQFYQKKDKHVIAHLFRVAAGMESLVLGENQILGQAKEAYSAACAAKSAGKIIHRLFHQAFRVGKQVRTDTGLGKGACSIAGATIDLLRTKIKPEDKPIILFIGLNKMITLAVARLNRFGYNQFLFANRTKQKAVDFANQYNMSGHGFDELPGLIAQADIIISCTGAQTTIITDDVMASVTEGREKKLLIADMAIPRDVELKNDYPNIELYDLETVQKFVEEKKNKRRDSLPEAEHIIAYKLEQFIYWYDSMRHEPAYNGLGEAYERIREHEMKKIYPMLDDDSRELVDRATKRLINKLLHIKPAQK